jgi:lysophospholipase L1-like esterase
VLAGRHAAELAPDLAVVAYGWNDHWLARGAVDAEKRVELRHEALYRRFRVLQLAQRAREALGVAPRAPELAHNRVPLESYGENLRAIVARLRGAGATAVVVTMPTTHDLELPGYLVEQGFLARAEGALEQHRAYNQVAREAAAEAGAELFDLERELAARPDRRQLFLDDGIHFSEAGRLVVAGLFADFAAPLPPLR